MKIEGFDNEVYPVRIDDVTNCPVGLCFVPGELNEFGGVSCYGTQVLKSAAGYYIGDLSLVDTISYEWEPYSRDSQYYWKTREEAELALTNNKYEVKY